MDLTNREKALAYFRHREAQIPMPGARAMYQEAIKAQEQPTVEPDSRKGRWQEDPSGYGFWICSTCGFVSEASGANLLYEFCPNCGARMEAEG